MIQRYFDKSRLEHSYYEKKVYSDYEKDINALKKEQNDIEKKIKTNEEKFTMIYDDKAAGVITLEEFMMLKNKYQNDNENCKLRINQINLEIAELEEKKIQNINEEGIFEKYKNIEKLDRLIVETFISKIIIGKVDPETKKRDIIIIWNVQSDLA